MSRDVKDWGDYEDDEELPAPVESGPDADGVVTRTEWAWKDGRKVRYVQKFQVEEVTTRVPKRTFARKTWARFGDAKDQHVRAEEQSIAIEDPNTLVEEEPAADIKNLGLIRQKLEARKKGLLPTAAPGDSFAEYEGPSGGGGGGGGDGEGGGPGMGRTLGERFGVGKGGVREDDKFPTIRVTNVSEDTTEDDLKQLFGRFGMLHRVFLAKDRERQTSRGFAFVSFLSKGDAQRAMDELQGYGYDHLILRLEWANPPSERRERAEGLAGMGGFVSGYGQKLAQDTTLAYSTASNLTHGTDRG